MIKLGVFLVCGWLSKACFQSHRIDKIGKSEWNQIEWVVWNIPLDPWSEFIKDGQVRYVVCTFDSTIQDKQIDKKIYSKDDNGKFSIT